MRELTPDAIDLRDFLRPGDTVLCGPSIAEPTPLLEALLAQRARLGGISVLVGTSYSQALKPEHSDHIRFSAFGGTGAARRLADAGVLDILPVHMSQVPELIASGRLKIDVVLAQLAVDETGAASFGAADLYMTPACAVAREIVAEVNDCAPWTYGRSQPDLSKVTAAVRTRRPLGRAEGASASEADHRIASLIAELVPDGATLQVGVGGLFAALSEALAGHRDLGIHSGTVGDLLVDLVERGVVTNARKPIDRGVTVVGTLLGSQRLFDYAHRNKAVRVDDASYVHAASTLARMDRLVSINSALEVDLTGQVNSEMAGQSYVGSIGGQADFVRGATLAAEGRSIIALRAAGRAPGQGRIVARIESGVATTARSDVDVVVTEYGVAHLRGRTLSERVEAMIAIAAPEYRDGLSEAAATLPGLAHRRTVRTGSI